MGEREGFLEEVVLGQDIESPEQQEQKPRGRCAWWEWVTGS